MIYIGITEDDSGHKFVTRPCTSMTELTKCLYKICLAQHWTLDDVDEEEECFYKKEEDGYVGIKEEYRRTFDQLQSFTRELLYMYYVTLDDGDDYAYTN